MIDAQLSNKGVGRIAMSSNHSITVLPGSSIVTESGDVLIRANAEVVRNDGDFNGLEVDGATIESGLGSIELTGVAGTGAATSEGFGLRINDSKITVTGVNSLGSIDLAGVGRNTSTTSTGVRIEGKTTVQAVDGDVSIDGQSSAGVGVLLSATSQISTATSDVVLTGDSVMAMGLSLSGSISSLSGSVSLTGTSFNDDGVFVSGSIETASGNIDAYGTASDATQGAAVVATTTAKIQALGGQISLTGTGHSGTLDGLSIACDLTSNSGPILLTGSTENAGGSGITVHQGLIGTSKTDLVRFNADTINLLADLPTAPVLIQGDGTLSFIPLSTSTAIGINATGTLVLDSDELASIADGFAQINFGLATTGTGLVTIDGAAFTADVSFYGGSVIVNELAAGTNRVELFAQTGSITGKAGAVRDIVAGEAALSAVTRIGDVTAGQPLLIAVNQLACVSNAGSIVLDNFGDLTVTAVGASVSGILITDTADDDSGQDHIELGVSGSLTVDRLIANNDQGHVLLKTQSSAADDITVNALVLGGDISIESFDDVTLGVALTNTVGNLSITAGVSTTDGTISQTGGLFINAQGDLIIESDSSLVVDSLTSLSRMTVYSESGSITTSDADEQIDFAASILGLEAATGIGEFGNNPENIIDVAASHMAARTSSGDIYCVFVGSVNLDQAFGHDGMIYGVEITDLDNDTNSGNDSIRLLGSFINVDRFYNSDCGPMLVSGSDVSVSVPNVDEVTPIDVEASNGTILYGMSARANLNVTGRVTIGGGGFGEVTTATPFSSRILVKNDGSDLITGRLAGLPEGSLLTINGLPAYLTYFGGDGNDLALVKSGSVSQVVGTTGSDQFEVRQVKFDDPEAIADVVQVQTWLGNTLVDFRPAAAGGEIDVSGLAGDDTLLLNESASGGFIIPTVLFDGGDGADVLRTSTQAVDQYQVSSLAVPVRSLMMTPSGNQTARTANVSDVELLEINLAPSFAMFEQTNQADNVTLASGGTIDMQLTSGAFVVNFKNPTSTIAIYGVGGDDSIALQSLNANFNGSVFVSGGDGADTITASALTTPVGEVGGAGNDTIVGSQGFDCVSGGDGDDSIVANAGNDLIFGGAGSDTISAGDGDDGITIGDGDGTDTIDGDNGNDRVTSAGADNSTQGDRFTIGDNAGRISLQRLSDPGLTPFSASIATVETIEVFAFGGNDSIDARNLTLSKLSIDAGTGDDVVYGGSMDDVLLAGSGADTVRGGAGNDVILGGADPDWLDGEAGDDRVRGQGASLDVLIGGLGTDTLDGGEGSDIVLELGDQNYVLTNSQLVATVTGTDSLVLVEAADLTGGNSANTINASAFTGATTLSGGAGNDTITGGTTADVINGDEGDDVLNGGDGNDRITGFGGNDLVNAGKGNDIVRGSAGRDTINGGDGDDKLYGQGSSFDLISGDAGNDTVSGGAGDDQLGGGDGDDFFVWEEGDGSDVMNGNAGIDRLRVYASKNLTAGDLITIRDNSGRIAFTRAANGAVSAFSLDMGLIERISIALFGGNDSVDASGLTLARLNVDGGFGNDTLIGGSQIDYMAGSVGYDSLVGGGGIDTLVGGLGADTCNGGAAVDVIDVSDNDAVDTVQNSSLDQVFSNLNDLLL